MNVRSYLGALAVAAVSCVSTIANAQSMQVQLVSLGDPVVSLYPTSSPAIGPFKMQGVSPLTLPFDAFCIDLQNGVNGGQIWNVRVLTFDEVISGANIAAVTRALGAVPAWNMTSLNQAAWLTQQFALNPVGAWDEIQVSIWSLFAPYALVPSDPAAAATFLSQSLSASGGDFSQYRLLVDEKAWDEQYQGTYVQTFMSTVPEPSTYALMGVGLMAVGIVARRRNKKVAFA